MTMPVPTPPAIQTIALPPPGYPMVTRMISDPLFPPEHPSDKEEPVTWVVSKPHPLVPAMNVVRMFVEGAGVAVYSVAGDGTSGMRNLIPTVRTRLVEEAMPLDIFIDELTIAESDADAPDDEEDESPEAPPEDAPPQKPQAVPPPDDDPPPATAAVPPNDGS